jgi:hypothetical protein
MARAMSGTEVEADPVVASASVITRVGAFATGGGGTTGAGTAPVLPPLLPVLVPPPLPLLNAFPPFGLSPVPPPPQAASANKPPSASAEIRNRADLFMCPPKTLPPNFFLWFSQRAKIIRHF